MDASRGQLLHARVCEWLAHLEDDMLVALAQTGHPVLLFMRLVEHMDVAEIRALAQLETYILKKTPELAFLQVGRN